MCSSDLMTLALAARAEGIFLVTDCMAFAGTDLTVMTLHGRQVMRRDGRLTLADGTLAGADLTLPDAVARLAHTLGIPEARALRMASAIPAALIGRAEDHGAIRPGAKAQMLLLDRDLHLRECVGF